MKKEYNYMLNNREVDVLFHEKLISKFNMFFFLF